MSLKSITTNRQTLKSAVFHLLAYLFLVIWVFVRKPYPLLKKRQLYSSRTFVFAHRSFSIRPPSFGYYPRQIQMTDQMDADQCRYG
jgi:hypothetical protein